MVENTMPNTLDVSSVLEILRPVQDPELQKSLVELNMIRNIKIDGGVVSFTLVLTTPACPLREFIVEDCQKAVKQLPGVEKVAVEGRAEKPPQKRGDAKVMVGDGKSGKSLEPAFNYGVKLVSMAFLIDKDQPVIWRGPMLNGIIRQFLYQVNWGDLDYLIVDMPPGTGDAQLTMAQAVPMAGVVIVTTPQTVALLDSRKGLKMFQQLGVSVLGIGENMSYFVPPDIPDKQYDIFGSGGGEKTAAELGVPLLGRIPLEIPLREGGDSGVPIVVGQPGSASARELRAIAGRI